jgi:hypothetical protein
MSSTNRSDARNEHIADYYVTPVTSIMDFLMEFFNDNPDLCFNGKVILDPCAGGDIKHPMSYPTAIMKYEYDAVPIIKTIDIREDSLAEVRQNYFFTVLDYKPDVIITNPPFGIAREIIEKALRDVKDGGLVIMLLRLNFFGSQSRYNFWKKNMPTFCYVHNKRIGFTDNGVTDSIEYMHCVWIKGANPKFVQLRIV